MTGDNYIFPTGAAAAPRLLLLEKIYGPSTRMLLEEIGLMAGFRVAEVGCGVGLTLCHLARAVGPTGRVLAIDISREQLQIARSNVGQMGLKNVDFIEASATMIGLPSTSVDLVFSRLLLSHIRQPAQALAKFRRILKVGGNLVCEDLVASEAYSVPELPVFERMRDIAVKFGELQGVDYLIGNRLPQLAQQAGLDVQGIRKVQAGFFKGEEKRWWEYSIREASPVLQKTGFLDTAQLAVLLDELQTASLRQDVMVALPGLTQVRARRAS